MLTIIQKLCIVSVPPDANPLLFFSTTDHITRMPLNKDISKQLLFHTLSLTFDHRNSSVCFIHRASNESKSFITCTNENFVPYWSRPGPVTFPLECKNVNFISRNSLLKKNLLLLLLLLLSDVNCHPTATTHVALDWISGNWYFVDDTNEMIFVCSSLMTSCIVLIDVNISKPRAIALDPTKG